MSHTPGPWQTRESDSDYASVVAVIGNHTKEIADVSDDMANARLIAASPELLEACRVMDRAWDEFVDDGDKQDRVEWAIAGIRTAIAKAEGRE